LKIVALVLKKFLAHYEYNVPYFGGISSYSLVLLIVAYYNSFGSKYDEELTPSKALMGFLDFYGNCFKPELAIINVASEQ
jgi:DNA polymerase sigma